MPQSNALRRASIALVSFGALALGIGSLLSDAPVEAEGADALPNQVWIDRVPESDRDMITHMVLLDHPRMRNFGVIGHSSQWRHHLELMRWGLDGERLKLVFPQDRRKAKLRARTWECEGEAPDPFELCLELRAGDRSLKMYSRRDWVVEPQAEAVEALVEDNPELRGLRGLELDAPPRDEDEDAPGHDSDWASVSDWLP